MDPYFLEDAKRGGYISELIRRQLALEKIVREILARSSGGGGTGLTTSLDTTNFNAILSAADANVQLAMDTLDNHDHQVASAWSPTISGVTVGNGTTVANYVKRGSIYFFWFSFTLGNTSAVTGDVSFTLPATPAYTIIGVGQLTDTGTAAYMAWLGSSGGSLYVRVVSPSGSYLTLSTLLAAAVPFVWTTGDVIIANGFFKV